RHRTTRSTASGNTGRRQTRPSHFLRVEVGTLPLHPLVKITRLQPSVQLFIERMRDGPWQLRVHDPKPFLSSLLLSSAQPHARILRTSTVDHTIFFLRNPDSQDALDSCERFYGRQTYA